MKQTFREQADTSQRQRLRALRRRGWLSLSVGGFVLVVLLAGNLVACNAEQRLQSTERNAFQQPPQWGGVQRLLYKPLLRVEPYRGSSNRYDNLLGGSGSSAASVAQADSVAIPYEIVSRPLYAGTVGRRYRYHVQAEGADDGLQYRLTTYPLGMEIDAETGRIEWVPEVNQDDKHPIEVVAVGPDGMGSKQTYELVVSGSYHPLGTDRAGRDMVAALILGTRWAVWPGLIAVSVSLVLGLLLGGLAGYYEGRVDTALGYFTHLSEAVPALVLLFLAAVIFHYDEYGLAPVMVVLGIVLSPGVARRIKVKVKALKAQQFIEASRELGLSDVEILWKDIVWYNARSILLERAFYGLALAVALEVTLSYLKIGILDGTSWGNMILEGRELLNARVYWILFAPAFATVLAMAGYYLLGNGLVQLFRAKKT